MKTTSYQSIYILIYEPGVPVGVGTATVVNRGGKGALASSPPYVYGYMSFKLKGWRSQQGHSLPGVAF
jgi:hypothetical protein